MIDDFYIVGSTAHSLINFRYSLIKSVKKKYNVTALSQDYNYFTFKKLKKIKVNFFHYGIKKNFFINEIYSFFKIIRTLYNKKKIKVLSYTFRGNIYVGLASLLNTKIEHYPMITGLGGIFLSKKDSTLNFLIYYVFKFLLKISLLKSKAIIFQNKDDKNFFNKNIIKKKFIIVPGSGVDFNYYSQKAFPKKITFMMISRIIKNKGIENFFNVSKKFYKINKKIQFIFVGQRQKKFSLNKNLINFKNYKNIKILRWSKDAKSLYKKCSIYVLPSKREGMSRTILEAMSSGRPIITSNVPGCKDAVINGFNGFLVNYNDNNSLFLAMKKFIEKPYLIKKFGLNSRKRIIKSFDVTIVNKKINKLIN